MRLIRLGVWIATCSLILWAPIRPARAEARTLVEHGHARTDEYYWLRDRENPEVIEYLEAENAYTAAALAHTRALQEKLFEEIVGRIKPTDAGVPYRKGDYLYYHRYEEGQEYKVHCRRRGSMEAPEEVLLDGNEMGTGSAFFSLRGLEVSPSQDILAFATDTVGRRFYTIRFKSLGSGALLEDVIPNVTGSLV